MSAPHFIVDRVEGGYAVVWAALTDETLDIPLPALPEGVSEGEGLALVSPPSGPAPVRLLAIIQSQAVLAVESVLRLTCHQGGLPPGAEVGDALAFIRLPLDAEAAAMAARIRRLSADDDGGDWSI